MDSADYYKYLNELVKKKPSGKMKEIKRLTYTTFRYESQNEFAAHLLEMLMHDWKLEVYRVDDEIAEYSREDKFE